MQKSNTNISTHDTHVRDKKRRLTRRAIRRAAFDLVLENGLDAVSVNDIARSAGVSPRTFFNYFASKDDALMADDDEEFAHLRDMIVQQPADLTPLAAIRESFRELSQMQDKPKKSRQEVKRRQQLVNENQWLRDRQAVRFSQLEDILAEAIAVRRGRSAPEHHARLLASLVCTTIRVSFQTWPDSDQELSDLFNYYFDTLEKGFTSD